MKFLCVSFATLALCATLKFGGMTVAQHMMVRALHEKVDSLDLEGQINVWETITKDMQKGDKLHFRLGKTLSNNGDPRKKFQVLGKPVDLSGFYAECEISDVRTDRKPGATTFIGQCEGSTFSDFGAGIIESSGQGELHVYDKDDFEASIEADLAGKSGLLGNLAGSGQLELQRTKKGPGEGRRFKLRGKKPQGVDQFIVEEPRIAADLPNLPVIDSQDSFTVKVRRAGTFRRRTVTCTAWVRKRPSSRCKKITWSRNGRRRRDVRVKDLCLKTCSNVFF